LIKDQNTVDQIMQKCHTYFPCKYFVKK